MKTQTDPVNIHAAFARAVQLINPVEKDATNPHFKNRYTSLDAVLQEVKKALAIENLSLTQAVSFIHPDNTVAVKTTVVSADTGELLDLGTTTVPTSKLDAQGFGSAATYGKRYSLVALFGIEASDDDDGAGASQHGRIVAAPPGATSAHAPAKTRKISANDTEVDPFLD